jgi:hypothetical protein
MNKSDVVRAAMGDSPFVIGEKVFIRTITYHMTGRIIDIKSVGQHQFLVLDDAAWIASSARFSQTIKKGDLDEVEPTPGIVRISVGAIVDVFCWEHPLPKVQK